MRDGVPQESRERCGKFQYQSEYLAFLTYMRATWGLDSKLTSQKTDKKEGSIYKVTY